MEKIKTSNFIKFIQNNIDDSTCYKSGSKDEYYLTITKGDSFKLVFNINSLANGFTKLLSIDVSYKHKCKNYEISLTPEAINSIDVNFLEQIEGIIAENFMKIKDKTIKQDAIKALYTLDKIIKEVK